MEPVHFEGANSLLLGNNNDVGNLPVFKGKGYIDGGGKTVTDIVVSCWELNEEELEKVIETKRIYLVAIGQTHPPVSIITELET